jgi:hypothetical protein
MAFINWGHEAPEQKEIRKRFEDRELFEQAMMAYARSSSAIATTGGGSLDPLNGLYGVGIDGLIYSLNRGEANWPYNYEPFPSITQITLNTDDGFLYAIVDFGGGTYFIRIDRTTRDFTFIENNISDYTVKGASSLYYEGNGTFIYLDNYFKKAISSIVRIELDPLLSNVATATQVSEVDPEETGYLIRNLFIYDEAIWAIAANDITSDFITGPFDIETGTFTYSNILVPSPSEPNISSIDTVFGSVEHNGIVYVDAGWLDSEDNYSIGLFKMDTETGGAVSPYYLTIVKDLFIESAEDVQIASITHF